VPPVASDLLEGDVALQLPIVRDEDHAEASFGELLANLKTGLLGERFGINGLRTSRSMRAGSRAFVASSSSGPEHS
jgi:hypothetical protein